MNIAKYEKLPINKIRFIEGNRDVEQSHVQKMYELISENGFADAIKVLKRSNGYYALEGQHRVESLKLHNVKEVPCLVVDWLDGDFEEIQSYIIDLNAHNKAWSLYDYVKSWADKKLPHYIHLRNQMIKYQKTLSNGVVATCYDGIIRAHAPLKKGKLKFVDTNFSADLVDAFSNLVIQWGKRKINSNVLRVAATIILKSDDKYGLLKAFQFSVNSHLAASKEPLPDGDDSFNYWFENVVENVYMQNK